HTASRTGRCVHGVRRRIGDDPPDDAILAGRPSAAGDDRVGRGADLTSRVAKSRARRPWPHALLRQDPERQPGCVVLDVSRPRQPLGRWPIARSWYESSTDAAERAGALQCRTRRTVCVLGWTYLAVWLGGARAIAHALWPRTSVECGESARRTS